MLTIIANFTVSRIKDDTHNRNLVREHLKEIGTPGPHPATDTLSHMCDFLPISYGIFDGGTVVYTTFEW